MNNMNYMNGHAPQIGDTVEISRSQQRMTVTGIPQAGVVRCGSVNIYARDCVLLTRARNTNYQNQGGFYASDALAVQDMAMMQEVAFVEDMMIMDTAIDIAVDVAIMDDMGMDGMW
jgi:hypothetical protein